MKIGLIQIDGKLPNLALMKLASWHKKKGDEVIFIDLSSLGIKKWYGSKIFMGGSGYNIKQTLPKDIEPPGDVQTAMNEVVKAENVKIASIDIANAAEVQADGEKRAKIKSAEGVKESLVLEATGRSESIKKVADARAEEIKLLAVGKAEEIRLVADAKAEEIKLVNESLQKHFKGSSVEYKQLETAERALKDGTKYVIDSKSKIMNVMSEAAGVPIPVRGK